MVIGLLTARSSIPEAHSLKDRRSVIRMIRDRVRNRMNVSVAETGKQDAWKSAEMAFVTIAADSTVVQKRLSEVTTMLRSTPRFVLIDLHTELL